MSAITKPLVNSTATSTASDPVNAEDIVTFSKTSVTNPIGSSTPLSEIVFSMRSTVVPIIWVFANDTARDAEYVKLLTLLSTPIV